MDYSLLTEQQLQKRYYSLPEKLKDILDSENNLKIIHQICRAHQLNDDEKILIIEQLVGLILLGFVSADDLSREISENLHLNHRHSDDIAFEMNRKIFAPIWSEIEKAYSPVSEGEREEREIEPTTDNLQLTTDNQQEMRDKAEPISMPIEIRKPEAFMVNKVEPPIRIIGFEEEKRETQLMDSALPYREAPAEVQIKEKITAINEEPLIIHEETELKPLSESKKSFKSLGGLFGFLKKKEKPGEIKPVRAEIEGIKPIETKIKVVDYTEVPEVLTNNQQPTTDNLQHTESPIKIIEEEKPIKESEIEEVEPLEEIRRVASEAEPPIKIIDEENHQITNQNEYTNKIEGIEKTELEEKIEKSKDEIMTTTMTEEKKFEEEKKEIQLMDSALPYREVPAENTQFQKEKETAAIAELPFDGPVIISQETEPKPKKKFFSGLTHLFKKKTKIETKTVKETEAEKETA
ncbi:MAG: hypothetical protein AAB698_01330 [Patescibacteria group bacterium]